MPLAREALRICAVRALRADPRLARWIGGRVRDSEQGPVEDYVEDKALPEVLVYTDDGKFGAGAGDVGMYAGGEQRLVIEVVMTQRMRVAVESAEGAEIEWAFVPPPTDSAMELTLGMIERLIVVALSEPMSPWAEMFRRFALEISEMEANRGSSMRDGVRFAGRQIVLPITVPRDPAPGQGVGPLWTDFLTLIDSDDELSAIAPMLRAMVEGEAADMPDWQSLRGSLGMTEATARSLNLATPSVLGDDEPAIVSAVVDETAP